MRPVAGLLSRARGARRERWAGRKRCPTSPISSSACPAVPTGAQVAPVFVDAFEEPGRLLYRFDAVIANQGGTLDLFRDPGSGGVRQAVWPGRRADGRRRSRTSCRQAPRCADRSGSGAGFAYAYEKTHQHWHFSSAARYELQPAGGAARAAEKVGFCMFDSFGPAHHFAYAGAGARQGRRGAASTRRRSRR